MTQKLKYLCIVMTLLGLLMIGGCSNTRNTFLESKNDIDTYLGKLATLGNYKDIKFHGILKGDGEKYKTVALNYTDNYNKATIGNRVLEFAAGYFSIAMGNEEVQNLDCLELYIMLDGTDEDGNKAMGPLTIMIAPNKIDNVNWGTLTKEQLKLIARIQLDPTLPV